MASLPGSKPSSNPFSPPQSQPQSKAPVTLPGSKPSSNPFSGGGSSGGGSSGGSSSGGGGGGGSSGGGSSAPQGFTSNNPALNTNPNFPSTNPQAASIRAQEQARTLARQNDQARANANQSDTNYSIAGNLTAQQKADITKSKAYIERAGLPSYLPELNQKANQNQATQKNNIKAYSNDADMSLVTPAAVSVADNSFFGKANRFVAKYTTEPFFSTLEKYNVNLTSSKFTSQFAPSLLGVGPIGLGSSQMKELSGGITAGIFKEVREKPATTAATFGAGYGVGLGFKGVSIGAAKIAPKLSSGINILGYGTGAALTGIYGVQKGSQVYSAQGFSSKGEIIGSALVETSAAGLGFSKGVKGAQQLTGFASTFGRKEIPFEKLTQPEVLRGELSFPEVPKSEQLTAFKTGSYKGFTQPIELTGGKQGAFHTTPAKFFDKQITPKAGTSELEGLYGSLYISPNFAKLGGSSVKSQFFAKLKGLAQPSGVPAVAFLKPQGFRYSPYELVGSPVFEGQKPTSGKFASFKMPAKEGFADVPLMKNEVEAVFRQGAGSYNLESKNFYTRINGIRVGIDTFSYNGKGGTNTLGRITKEKGGYSLPKENIVSSKAFGSGLVVASSLPSSKLPYSYSLLSYKKSGSNSYPSSPKGSSFSLPSYPKSNRPSIPSYPKSSSFSPSSSYKSGPFSLPSYPTSSSMMKSYSSYKSNDLSGLSLPKMLTRGRKVKSDIAPSFTAIVGDYEISAPIKVSKKFGVTPFQLRGLKSKKFKGKVYFKEVDF